MSICKGNTVRQEFLSTAETALSRTVMLVVQTQTARFPKHATLEQKLPLPFQGRGDDTWPRLLPT